MSESSRRGYALDAVRSDHWLDDLCGQAPQLGALCEAIGERTVAFSIIAGVRIVSLALNRQQPDSSIVEFVVGEATDTHQLNLGELRRRLASTLSTDEAYPGELPDGPDEETLRRFVGYRHVLLAPLFGFGLLELRVGDGEPGIVVEFRGTTDEMPLAEFRSLILERVAAEGQGAAAPFSLDLNLVIDAQRRTDAEDWNGVIEVLGNWPGPLSMLLRTAEGQNLAEDVKQQLALALGMLGSAYAAQENVDWAEEIIRLGIQWGQQSTGPALGELFWRLGEIHLRRGQHGQAIGVLRRAQALGVPEVQVLPVLGMCFAARGRRLPALLCLESAAAQGGLDPEMEALRDEQRDALGEAWTKFRELVPAPSAERSTWRPPEA